MIDSILTILLLVLIVIVLPVGLLLVRDRVRNVRRRRTPEQIRAEALRYRERLLHPDQRGVETQIGGLLPERLIRTYNDHQTILSKNIEIRSPRLGPDSGYRIEMFLPLDSESQRHTWDVAEAGWGNGFCFAADGAGNFYWVPVHPARQQDTPVFFACHDPWGNEKIAESLDEFLSWLSSSTSRHSDV